MVGIAQGKEGCVGGSWGAAARGTAAAETLSDFLSACLSRFLHREQGAAYLRGMVHKTQACKAACFPGAASLNCPCFQGVLEVQPADKSSLETTAKGCCSQH